MNEIIEWLVEYHVSIVEWYISWLTMAWPMVGETPVAIFMVLFGSILWGAIILIFLAIPSAMVVGIVSAIASAFAMPADET